MSDPLKEIRDAYHRFRPDDTPQPDEVIVVVRPGTRVRYVENPWTPKPVLFDAALLDRGEQPWSALSSPTVSMPIRDAEIRDV